MASEARKREVLEVAARSEQQQVQQLRRLSAFAACILGGLAEAEDEGRRRRGVSLIFFRWACTACHHARIKQRWRALVHSAERTLAICHPAAGPGWRVQLLQRSHATHVYYRRAHWRCKQTLSYDRGRIAQAIFSVWRTWAQNRRLAEENAFAEARHSSIHVSAGPWWLH